MRRNNRDPLVGLASQGMPGLSRGVRIGLLGGSFNPAHAGHRHISLIAMRRLRLDAVWWLVSPQNPLKSTKEMADFSTRLTSAQATAQHPRIIVTDLEQRLGTRYTADTLHMICKRFRGRRFVWLMGADNLRQISYWEKWHQIYQTIPIAVLARPSYSQLALVGQAAQRFRLARRPEQVGGGLLGAQLPAWMFLLCRQHPASATAIRRSRVGLS